jgi:hypothetical protein
MQSLSELNLFGNIPITYTDQRPAGVIFDRDATPDQLLNISNLNPSAVIVPNFNILEIINYQVANLRYELEIISPSSEFKNLSSITFLPIPAYMNISVVGKKYTVSGFRSVADWDLLKSPLWTLPGLFFNYPSWYVRASIFYYDQSLNQEIVKDWDIWDPRFYLTSKIQSRVNLNITANANFKSSSASLANFNLNAVAQSAFFSIVSNFGISCSAGVIKRPATISMPATTSLNSSITAIVQDYLVLSQSNNLIFYNASQNYSSFNFSTSLSMSITDVDWDTTGYKIAFTESTPGQPSSPGALKILNRVNNNVSLLTQINYTHIVRSVSWNPLFEYVAVGSGNSFSTNSKKIKPDIFKFQNNILTPIQISDLPDDQQTSQFQTHVRWSPDGQYLAVVNYPGVAALQTYPGRIYFYKKTGNDIFSLLSSSITLSSLINDLRWSPDSQFFGVFFSTLTAIYRKESNDTFQKISDLWISPDPKRSGSWSRQGTNIAVGQDGSPNLRIWNQNSTVFTEISGIPQVDGNGSPVIYSNIGNRLAVGHNNGSRITFYTYNNNVYTKFTGSYSTPNAQPTRISWRKAV